MIQLWAYSIASVVIVSLISLAGLFTLSISTANLKKILIYLVSFAAGGLLGDAFIHLLPEIVEETQGFGLLLSFYVLSGIVAFFVLEKLINWHHYHLPHSKEQLHSFALTNLIGDAFHNFIDGLIIGGSYLLSIPAGIATTLAVIFHEIPQEIGDFGVLIHGGFSVKKALFYNFLIALTAVAGTIIALLIGQYMAHLTTFLIPFAAGGFIYVAVADLIPELHKETRPGKSALQLSTFLLGIGVMVALLMIE